MLKPRMALTSTGWVPRMAGRNFQLGRAAMILAVMCGGTGFEDLEIFQVAGSVESALDDDAGVRKVRGQIGAKALRAGRCSGLGVRGGIDFGELHHDRADRCIHIDGVVVARELAVEIKRAAGARRGDDGDGRSLLRHYRGVCGEEWERCRLPIRSWVD